MKYRVAMWSLIGFLVAAFWAVFAAATFPSTTAMRDVWTFVSVSCPIALAGLHHHVSLYQVLVANALTYGVVGLVVETLRKQLHQAG